MCNSNISDFDNHENIDLLRIYDSKKMAACQFYRDCLQKLK